MTVMTAMNQRALVYGVGIIGSVYAVRLARAGHQVTVLARGERLAAIRADGLRIRHVFLLEEERAEVEVIEALDPERSWDVVLIAVRADQVPAAVAEVARCKNVGVVAVIGNNVVGHAEQAGLVGTSRFVLGFGSFGGVRDGGWVTYLDGRTPEKPGRRGKTTLGVLAHEAEPALARLAALLESAQLPSVRSHDMVAWLQCHAALVVPLVGAINACGGGQARVCRTRDALVLGLRACRELLGALSALGVRTEPRALAAFRFLPELILVRRLQKGLMQEAARVVVFGHANAAGGHAELAKAAQTLDALVRKAGLPLPNWHRLFPAFSVEPGVALLEDGRRDLRLRLW